MGGVYELDMDKVSRLNSLNSYALSYADLSNAAQLNSLALGITITQVMDLNVAQSSNVTVDDQTTFTFTVSASVNSKPQDVNLRYYVIADNYCVNSTSTISESGVKELSIGVPTSLVNDALLVVLARAPFDERVTSYAVYNFSTSAQESSPSSNILALSPLNYAVNFNDNLSGASVDRMYVFSYAYAQTFSSVSESPCTIPKVADKSPLLIVVSGQNSGTSFVEWTAYPQVPLQVGANFAGSAQNVFRYIVTIGGVLYNLDLSLGDIAH